MKRIRAYFLFTSWKYKLGIFLGLPAAVLALGLAWRRSLDQVPLYGYVVTVGLIIIEIMTDQGVFNGIQSRRGYRLDYLKTSRQGAGILQWGLILDLVRRLLTAALCIGLSLLLRIQAAEGGILTYLGIVLVLYSTEALGLLISRCTRSVVLCLLAAYGCAAVGVAGSLEVYLFTPPWLWIEDMVLMVIAAFLSLQLVRIPMKRWRQTYADTQN